VQSLAPADISGGTSNLRGTLQPISVFMLHFFFRVVLSSIAEILASVEDDKCVWSVCGMTLTGGN
jgi:hypothetical protein